MGPFLRSRLPAGIVSDGTRAFAASRILAPSPESFPGNRLQPGGRPQEPNRDGKSRTLVLTATMRSPTIGSPDQTQKRAHCAEKYPPRRGTAPDFPACAGVPKGPRNSKLRVEGDGDMTVRDHPP